MIPVIVYEALSDDSVLQSLGINGEKIFELQSVDERPFHDGCFIIINWQESVQTIMSNNNAMPAPRMMTVWVHQPWDKSRDYRPIDKILNRVEFVLTSLEQQTGSDGVRVTCVNKQGRSANLLDEAWKTISRNATYRVLYDESMA